MREVVEKYRTELIEKAIEADDVIMEKYLNGVELSDDELKAAIRKSVLSGKFYAVLGGDGRGVIVETLLDAITDYLPSPLDTPPAVAHDLKTDEEITITPSDTAPFAALAFKVAADPFVGKLIFFRVYRGTLTAGSYIVNTTTGEKERIGRIVRLHANSREDVNEVFAGDIAAAVGLKATRTGDTLCDPQIQIRLESITFPEPVISMAVEPKTKADQEKMGIAIARLVEEDPTLRVKSDQETGQTILSGMGELHLEIIVDRMKREFKVEVTSGKPQVAYKETIRKEVSQEGKFIRQSGGRGQYGHVYIRVAPSEGGIGLEFENKIVGGSIPKEYIPAVEKGVKEAMERGVVAGYPVEGLLVTLYDGTFHDVDSSEMAFHIAGSMGLQDAVKKSDPAILEPIMKVEVTTPEEFMGDVIGDLNAKRGQILAMSERGTAKVVDATVPLSSMFGYATTLRSMSQGRASYTMEFDHYEPVPMNIQADIISGKIK